MKAKIVFYSQNNLLPRDKTKFKEALAGRNTSSLGRRYKYKIKGLLDQIKNIRPCRSAIIISNKDYPKLTSLMDKHKVKYDFYVIEVPNSRLKK